MRFKLVQLIPSKYRMTPCYTDTWLVVLAVCLFKTAESLNCTETVEKNGSALYKISEPPEPHCEADWAINGTVVAYEGHVNETLVQLLTQDSLRLIHRFPKTTYRVDCGKELIEVSCNGPIRLGEPLLDDANKLNWRAILAGVVIALLALLVILSVVFCRWKNKGCFRKKEKEQGDPEASEQLKGDGISIEMV